MNLVTPQDAAIIDVKTMLILEELLMPTATTASWGRSREEGGTVTPALMPLMVADSALASEYHEQTDYDNRNPIV